ncbi:MAG: low specificity L-threonine aldolase [Halanaerobiales bacterium]|nr:low specificity L-threonine aldolase [Halanaerobiales bacterium]
MKMFLSDNASGVHPKILEAIKECNTEHELPYGNDIYTKKAIEKFVQVFEKDVDVYFVANGTGANVLGLSCLLRSFESVICADTAHINVHECGALERITGSKILYTPNDNGKISVDDVKKFLHAIGDEHETQPRVISITQATEVGTVYSVEEIKVLSDFAHGNNLFLHVDGARISNAAVYLGVSLKEMITDTGVDMLSFGGTKNGMMFGEAIISFNPEVSKYLKYFRKQGMQLISKMRYISSQFIAYLENDLWRENAEAANSMAKLLETKLKTFPEIKLTVEVQSNIIFAEFPGEWIKTLQDKCYLYITDEETNLVRMVTSFDTSTEDIEEFIDQLKQFSIKY